MNSASKSDSNIDHARFPLALSSFLAILIGAEYDGINGTFVSVNALWLLLIAFASSFFVWRGVFRSKPKNAQELAGVLAETAGYLIFTVLCLLIGKRTIEPLHGVPYFFTYLIRAVATCLGLSINSGTNEYGRSMIYLCTPFGYSPISVTAEKLVTSVLITIVAWCLVFGSSIRAHSNRLVFYLSSAAVLLIWEAVRLVLLGLISVAHDIRPDIFWNPFAIIVSFIPMAVVLDILLKYFRHKVHNPKVRESNLQMAIVFGLLAVFIVAFWYIPGGKVKNGAVLIDDMHANWEWSDLPFNENTYDEHSMYSSSAFRYLLSRYWKTDVNKVLSLDQIDLAKYSVLVLKTPTRPYSNAEREAITRYVENGGGLLMIGDHTDLFGMSHYLNSVGQKFNIRFNYDDQFALTTGIPTSYRASSFWSHPMVKNLTELDFLTTCTLSVPTGSDVIIGTGMGVETMDYSHLNFFGDMTTEVDENWGSFVQMAAVDYGKGRVVAFADSTCMSTFCLFFDCKPTLWIHTVDFLNRASDPFVSRMFITLKSIGIPCLFVSLLLCLLWPSRMKGWLFIGMGGIGLIYLCGLFNTNNYPTPRRNAQRTIVFDDDKSLFQMPSMVDFSAQSAVRADAFDSFFLSFYRKGFEPYINNPLELTNAPLLKVIINPRPDKFDEKDCHEMIGFMSDGGKILILANFSDVNTQDALRTLLNAAGKNMFIVQEEVQRCAFEQSVHFHHHIGISDGDEGFATGKEAGFDVHRLRVGRGTLYLAGGSTIFSRAALDPVYNLNLSDDQRRAYRVLYAFIDYILEDGSADSVKKSIADYLASKSHMPLTNEEISPDQSDN